MRYLVLVRSKSILYGVHQKYLLEFMEMRRNFLIKRWLTVEKKATAWTKRVYRLFVKEDPCPTRQLIINSEHAVIEKNMTLQLQPSKFENAWCRNQKMNLIVSFTGWRLYAFDPYLTPFLDALFSRPNLIHKRATDEELALKSVK